MFLKAFDSLPPASIIPIFIPPFVWREEIISPFWVIISNTTSALVSAVIPPALAAAFKPFPLKAFWTAPVIIVGFVFNKASTEFPIGPDTYAPKPPYSKPFFHFVIISAFFSEVKPFSLVTASIVVIAAGTEAIVVVIPAFKICPAAFCPKLAAILLPAEDITPEPGKSSEAAIVTPISA